MLGASYELVFFLSSLFLFYAFYQFTKHFSINKFYLITIYLGFPFLYLNFGAVRQSLAVGFLILGCNYYLCHQNKIRSLFIASIGLLFHLSSFIYLALFAAVIFYKKINIKSRFLIMILSGIICLTYFIDFRSLNSLFPALSYFFEKITLYKNIDREESLLISFYLIYLIFLMVYINRYKNSVAPKQKFILQYALVLIFTSVLLAIIYSNSYVFYTRLYLLASIFHGYAIALILSVNKGRFHFFIFVLTIIIALFYYLRILYLNMQDFIPYKTFIYAYFN